MLSMPPTYIDTSQLERSYSTSATPHAIHSNPSARYHDYLDYYSLNFVVALIDLMVDHYFGNYLQVSTIDYLNLLDEVVEYFGFDRCGFR